MLTSCPGVEDPIESEGNERTYIKWKILDHSTNRILSEDENTFSTKDLQVKKRISADDGVTVFYDKNYVLPENFIIGISIFPEENKSDYTGFGMWFNKSKTATFSWEWFDITSNTTAIKLQGDGELEIILGQVDSEWQVVSVKFLSDCIFRCLYKDNEDNNVKNIGIGPDFRWSCIISKGSVINFRK